jgi:hypothetical protein
LGLLALVGCSPSRFPEPFFISVQPAMATMNIPGRMTVSAQCKSGYQLLGGGYAVILSGSLSAYIPVIANYPSAADTWTVIIDSSAVSSSYVQGSVVIADAYCLTTPNFPLNMTKVSTKAVNTQLMGPQPAVSATGTATCPTGSVTTGGGFMTAVGGSDSEYRNANVLKSAPARDDSETTHQIKGWEVDLFYEGARSSVPTTTVFALCAQQNLAPAVFVGQSRFSSAFIDEMNSVKCPSGMFTTGGGYALSSSFAESHVVTLSYATDEFGAWRSGQVLAPGTEINTQAVCIPVPNIPFTKVKITSPANGATFPITSGADRTAPITFIANATNEQGESIPGLQWSLNGVPVGNGQTTTVSTQLGSAAIGSVKVGVTAIGKTTSASDQITISVVRGR